MDKKQTALEIAEVLKKLYPDVSCSLEFGEPWQLLFSARLAAQCTDKRVNEVAKILYVKYKTLEDVASADIGELEATVKSTGFYHTKARDLKNSAIMLLSKFGGRVPDTMEELLTLPGVGRKIANLMLGDVYNRPAVVADTHCIRLSNRFGLCDSKDPKKVEFRLMELIPEKEQNDFCHRLVFHGRAICTARSPKCSACPLKCICEKKGL
jgi:endonuclease-3